jgi:hypothetical protein
VLRQIGGVGGRPKCEIPDIVGTPTYREVGEGFAPNSMPPNYSLCGNPKNIYVIEGFQDIVLKHNTYWGQALFLIYVFGIMF